MGGGGGGGEMQLGVKRRLATSLYWMAILIIDCSLSLITAQVRNLAGACALGV